MVYNSVNVFCQMDDNGPFVNYMPYLFTYRKQTTAMQSSTLSIFFTCATCCLYATLAYPLDDLDAIDTERLERELAVAAEPGNMSPSGYYWGPHIGGTCSLVPLK